MLPFLAAAGAVSSLLGGIFKGFQGHKQQKMANAINPVNPVYQESQYAKNQLGSVMQAYNGRMPGAGYAEQNIEGNQANTFGNVERNAGSGAQALALASGLQGNTNQAFGDLASKEAMNKESLLGQLGYANMGMTAEGDKVYNDKLRNYNNDVNAKQALQSAAWKNKGNAVSDFGDTIIGAGNVAEQMSGGAAGGGGSMSGQTTYSSPQSTQAFNPAMAGSQGYIDPNYNPFIRS